MNNDLISFKNKKVLFVEDDKIMKIQIIEVLSMLFKEVYSAENGRDAYLSYKSNLPDLIISDIKMPIMDGLKLVEKIREEDYTTPIILLTNFNEKEYLLHAANLSIDAYIFKPLEFNILVDTIRKAMKRTFKEYSLLYLAKDLHFNSSTQELYLKNEVVSLGIKELELLKLLIDNSSRTVTKDEISSTLWPLDDICDSAIKNLVLRIRKKVDLDIIVSVRGLGYRLNIPKN